MNRTILQRRRQRERWKRLAVEMGPHPSLPPRARRMARFVPVDMDLVWLLCGPALPLVINPGVVVPVWPDIVPVIELRDIAYDPSDPGWMATPGRPVYVQELRAGGQVSDVFLAEMLAREEGDGR